VILNLGTVLLEPAIDRHLPERFRDPGQLERWNRASTLLFTEGVLGPAGGVRSTGRTGESRKR